MSLYASVFSPGPTQAVLVTAESQLVPLHPEAALVRLLLVGEPGAMVFVAIGTGPLEVTDTGFPLLVNDGVLLMKGVGANSLAVIGNLVAVDALLYVTTGG